MCGRGLVSRTEYLKKLKQTNEAQSACFKTYDRSVKPSLEQYNVMPTREIKSPPKADYVIPKRNVVHSLQKTLIKYDEVGRQVKEEGMTQSRFGTLTKKEDHVYDGAVEQNTVS